MRARRLAVTVLAGWFVLAGLSPAVRAQEVCGDITRNTTWGPDKTHIIGDSCTVNVRGATLTLQPGTLVQMGKEANLVFQSGSDLVAEAYVEGTAGAIQILANARDATPGYWGQIRFEPGAKTSSMRGVLTTGNQIIPVVVSHGGSGGVPMVEARGQGLLLDWVLLQHALEEPLAYSAASLGPSLQDPGSTTVGGACQRVQLGDNGLPGIEVYADDAVDIDTETTWHSFCVPYFLDSELRIAGPDLPTLKLDVGVTVRFGQDGALVAGLDQDNPGLLELAGTAADPILLSGREETPGSWLGVTLTRYSEGSSMSNAAIEYGGRGDVPMVTVLTPDATAWFVEFRNAKTYPLQLSAEAVSSFTSSLARLTGDEPSAFVDNGIDRVLVLTGDDPVLSSNSAWGDLGVPYELDGSLIVAGPIGPRLSILAGAELQFPTGGQLIVGSSSEGPGELEVVGEEDRPAILTSIADAPGSWRGILVTNDASLASLDRVVVENGGSGGPMVDWGRVQGDISRVSFRGAMGYPLSVPVSVVQDVVLAPEVPDQEEGADLRNTFAGNGVNRVLVHVDRNYTISQSAWSDPGAPVEFDDTLVVTSPTQPLLQLKPGLRLLFRAGKTMDLGNGADGRASLLVSSDDASAAPVTIGPVDAAQGWGGLRVRKASSLSAAGPFQVSDPADTAAAITVQDATAVLNGAELRGQDKGTGLLATGNASDVTVEECNVTHFGIGLDASQGARLFVTKTVVQDNAVWGMRNQDPTLCLKAPLVYWGSAKGPNDTSDAEDGCLNGANLNPDGDNVSDDIDWWPYATDTQWTPSKGLGPNPWHAYCPFIARN